MAWIRVLDEGQAEGDLKRIYDEQSLQAGAVANILKIHSLRPRILATHMPFYAAIMHAPGSLSRAQREMIAIVVSTANGCHYWVEHHGAGLLRLTGNQKLLEQLRSDYRKCSVITESEQKMLAYAEKLTIALSDVSENDVTELREAGFSDEAILEINAAAAYMNFVNRVADGLGVEMEAGFAAFKR